MNKICDLCINPKKVPSHNCKLNQNNMCTMPFKNKGNHGKMWYMPNFNYEDSQIQIEKLLYPI